MNFYDKELADMAPVDRVALMSEQAWLYREAFALTALGLTAEEIEGYYGADIWTISDDGGTQKHPGVYLRIDIHADDGTIHPVIKLTQHPRFLRTESDPDDDSYITYYFSTQPQRQIGYDSILRNDTPHA